MSVATRAIPGTDLRISEIGFGCGGNAGLMLRGTACEQRAVIAHALASGITYFDTAPDYGDGAAERALGDILHDIGTPACVITTKVEIRAENLDDVAGHVLRSAEASLRRLQRDHIDILQIHNGPTPTPPAMEGRDYHHLWLDHFLGPNGAAEALRRLNAAGKIRYAGLVSRGADHDACETLLRTGLFRMINLSYNLLDPAAGQPAPDGTDLLGTAARNACGVAAFSPLAGGLLAGPAPRHRLARPANTPSRRTLGKADLAARIVTVLQQHGDPASLAWRFALAPHAVTTVIGGFSSVEQVGTAASLSAQTSLPDGMMAAIALLWEQDRQQAVLF